ncbi:MAG TPA: DUF732 domain-containing protein [Mycobacterium sp.]|jgi:hypothetical protein|uniref:DUF732 domain-containing protein n=1 Tax=Mycobacterium sp. TaxID=1785 RepID=UPI002F42A00B
MPSGLIRHLPAAVALVGLVAAALLPGGTATADPGQDQKFFDLLGQKDIPPVDNANSLIETAHKACSKLDGGMSVGDLVDLIRNNGYNENPLTRLSPPDRITRTINQFINASVQAYCPYDAGKIASIAGFDGRGSTGVTTDNPDRRNRSPVVVLASLTVALPAGEIPPTKPLPVPAQPPPPPEVLAPAPQQPPPRHVQQAPQRQQQVEPPPPEAPPQEAPPQAEQPQAPAPAPEPGGGNGGGNGGAPAPDSPSPAPPAPPGHIRLAP